MIEKTGGTDARQKVSIADLHGPVEHELGLVQEELSRFFVCDVALINQISKHMLRSHGKRFRPTLTLLVNKLNGEVSQKAVLAATIVELIHTATLVHDDSIDRSFMRRGIPTVNSIWNDQTSVIMGDYLYSKAFFLLVENNLMEVVQILARATHLMSLGEMLEIEKTLDFSVTEESYNRLIGEKTAVLISAACEIGAYLAWGNGKERRLMADFGMKLGMSFQIMDDILDIEGDAQTMGKRTGSDIRDGKITLPLIESIRNAPEAKVRQIRELMSNGIDDHGAADVVTFAAEYGGLDYARQRARGYADQAIELLDDFEDNQFRQTLHDSVEYVLQRRK
ncbi:MAG: polyprenyl synthetase family protein [Candidatus Eisenbacteria bacterium]|uniref:Polyprenyl synthetase family protein n=1 Tax=Eiseniibacteriota bacterium TaxID=2212470 RepID=A0A7Y2E5B2_UNCEI|nr:polyprenyl synthetase family protein [Candidatus Eisenbacteria bacterium]